MNDEADLKFREILLSEVRGTRILNESVVERMALMEQTQQRLHEARSEQFRGMEKSIERLTDFMFTMSETKTIVGQIKKDVDEHLKDHKWFGFSQILKAIVGGGGTVGVVHFISKNSDRLSVFFQKISQIGKAPPPQ